MVRETQGLDKKFETTDFYTSTNDKAGALGISKNGDGEVRVVGWQSEGDISSLIVRKP